MKLNLSSHSIFLPLSALIFVNFAALPLNTIAHFHLFSSLKNIQIFNLVTDHAVLCRAAFGFSIFYFKQGLFFFFPLFRFFLRNRVIPAFFKRFDFLSRAVSFGHYNIIQFVGFRYRQRWIRTAGVLKFKLGYNSKVWFKTPADFGSAIRKISPKKRTHFYFSFNIVNLRWLTRAIVKARPATLYKGRGVNLKEQPMVLHEGKKAIW